MRSELQRKRILLATAVVDFQNLIEVLLVACQGQTGGLPATGK